MYRRRPRTRSLATTLVTAAIALGLSTATTGANADDTIDPEDVLAQIPGLIEGLTENRADMLRCPDLAGGTAGVPEGDTEIDRDNDQGNPLGDGDATTAPAGLPDQVLFRSPTESFNRRYQFVTHTGAIFYKSNTLETGIVEPWTELALPDCFTGEVVGLSVDDDEMVVVDTDRWIYTMDGALASPASFNWTVRWGPPFWTGPGRQLPGKHLDWEWSIVSQIEDDTWPDDAGNGHRVGDAKVSHIWLLRTGGQRLTYIDPWLPSDESLEMCGPHRGRFKSVALSASGSTIFVVGRRGDLFTRLYDFDISGADPIFFDYTYRDQRGVASPKIQLPSPSWIEQPKIPGTVTDRISIHKVGELSLHRTLRVEGKKAGRTGYWTKDVAARIWSFVRTDLPLEGTVLDNPQSDTSAVGLGAGEDRGYAVTQADARIRIPNFNIYCSPAKVAVTLPTGERFNLVLHTVDNIRQFQRARGLDGEPRMVQGTLEVPPSLRKTTDPQIKAFLDALGAERFINAHLDATLTGLSFRDQGWLLTYNG
jgi:hypothetical protein